MVFLSQKVPSTANPVTTQRTFEELTFLEAIFKNNNDKIKIKNILFIFSHENWKVQSMHMGIYVQSAAQGA